MERQTWVHMGMVLTVVGLVGLNLIAPSFVGRPAELTTLPLLIVGLAKNESALIIDVGGAVQGYLYANATLEVRSLNPGTDYQAFVNETETYDVHLRVPVNASFDTFHVWAKLYDRVDNYFEYNITVRVYHDTEGRAVMAFSFPDEKDSTDVLRYPPDDFRWPIPRRGGE